MVSRSCLVSCVREAGEERGGHASPTPAAHRQGQGSPCDAPCPAASPFHDDRKKTSTNSARPVSSLQCTGHWKGGLYGYAGPALRPSPLRPILPSLRSPTSAVIHTKTCQDGQSTREQTAYTVRRTMAEWLHSLGVMLTAGSPISGARPEARRSERGSEKRKEMGWRNAPERDRSTQVRSPPCRREMLGKSSALLSAAPNRPNTNLAPRFLSESP